MLGQRKVPVTSAMSNIVIFQGAMGYQTLIEPAGEPVVKKRKHIRQSALAYTLS